MNISCGHVSTEPIIHGDLLKTLETPGAIVRIVILMLIGFLYTRDMRETDECFCFFRSSVLYLFRYPRNEAVIEKIWRIYLKTNCKAAACICKGGDG